MNRSQACKLGLLTGQCLVLSNPGYWPNGAPIFALQSAVIRMRTAIAGLQLNDSQEYRGCRDEVLAETWRHIRRMSCPNVDASVRLGHHLLVGVAEELRAVVAREDERRPADGLSPGFELGVAIADGAWCESTRPGPWRLPEPVGDGRWIPKNAETVHRLANELDVDIGDLFVEGELGDEADDLFFDDVPRRLLHWARIAPRLLRAVGSPKAPTSRLDARNQWAAKSRLELSAADELDAALRTILAAVVRSERQESIRLRNRRG